MSEHILKPEDFKAVDLRKETIHAKTFLTISIEIDHRVKSLFDIQNQLLTAVRPAVPAGSKIIITEGEPTESREILTEPKEIGENPDVYIITAEGSANNEN